jgi:hypothetical protein
MHSPNEDRFITVYNSVFSEEYKPTWSYACNERLACKIGSKEKSW